jgi:RHS repeat-associated protein
LRASSGKSADVLNANDYYPFGMMMPGRQWDNGNDYRYGFNGKENDNEVKGEGNQQDYGMRIYDPRLGKFLRVDPETQKLPQHSPYSYCFNNPILFIDPDGAYPIVTITKEVVGSAKQRVIGDYSGKTAHITTVNLYKVTVTDTEDKTFKMSFTVTRDAFAVKNGDEKNGQLKMTNVAFEPKDGKINHYTGKRIPGGYPQGDGTKALKLYQKNSEVVHAEPNDASVELGYRNESDVASGIMLHVGGYYKHADGTVSCAASEGCFGITNDKNSESNPSNDYSNEVLGKIIEQAEKSKTNKGKIEIVIEKRSASEKSETKTEKKQ